MIRGNVLRPQRYRVCLSPFRHRQHDGLARTLFAAAVFLPIAGCAVGPDFVAPLAPLADKYRNASSRPVKTTEREYRDWWKGFHDPILNQLALAAYNQNLTLLSAGTRVLQARAALGIAVGFFYPQVQQGTGSILYNQTSAATPLALPNATPSRFWSASLAAQAAWELDFWGKFRRGVESADGAYLASIATYDDVLVSLLGDVAAAYIGIRTTERLIAVANDNIAKQKQALSIAQAKFKGRRHRRTRRIPSAKRAWTDAGRDSPTHDPARAVSKRALRPVGYSTAIAWTVILQTEGPHSAAASHGCGWCPRQSAPPKT